MLPSPTALGIASATSTAFKTWISAALYNDINIDRRAAALCTSYVSTWGVDGQHFTQYRTFVPCVSTPATDTPTPTSMPTAAGSADTVQATHIQQLHDKFLGVVIGVPILAVVLIIAVFLWGKRIAKAEKKRLRMEALQEGRRENRDRIEELEQGKRERRDRIRALEQEIADLRRQPNQAQVQAQTTGAVNPQAAPTT